MNCKFLFLSVLIGVAGVSFSDVIAPSEDAAENTAVIQAALDAAAREAVPGTVTIGEGTFEINAQLMVTGGVTLVGQGWDKTIIKQTTSGQRIAMLEDRASILAMTVTGGKLTENWAHGAGMFVKDGTVSWCKIVENECTGRNVHGGGIHIEKGQIDHCIVAFNKAGSYTSSGGGIGMFMQSNDVLIDACLVYGNTASIEDGGAADYGGAGVSVIMGSPNVTIRNTTITDNSISGKCGGLRVTAYSPVKVKLVNSIVCGNKAVTDVEVSGTIATSSSNNLIGEEPAFIDAENNNYRLSKESPAISAGAVYEGIGLDLDGVAFSDPPSIGCYEVGDVVDNPQFTAASGSIFFPTMNVALTCTTEGAKIYYTTDGSNPTESSELYTAPFEISSTVTVKARAYAAGKAASGIVSATYTRKRPTPKLKEFRKFIEITLRSDLYNGEEAIAGLPSLVKLSEATIPGFRYSQFSLANGEDMMFVDENDKPIPHEVDTWNTKGESLIWVKIPSSAAQTKIKMYYGYGAISSEEPHDVWSDYTGVWHLNDATAAAVEYPYGTYANSTEVKGIDGHVAQYTKVDEPGRFGKSFRVNDSTGKQAGNFNYGGVWVNDSGVNSPIDGGKYFTISGWFKHDNFNYYWDHIFYKRKSSDNSNTKLPNNAFAIECNSQVEQPDPLPRGSGAGGNAAKCSGNLRDWAYLSFVFDNQKCFVYENGIKVGESSITACIDNDSPLVFGNNCDVASGAVGDAAWNGWIDEVRFSKGSKSAEWVAAEFKAMNTGDTDIFEYGEVQPAGSRGMRVIVR